MEDATRRTIASSLTAISRPAIRFEALPPRYDASTSAFLPVFVVVFYYDLDISLAYKSWILAGSGALLLVARWFLATRPWAKAMEPEATA